MAKAVIIKGFPEELHRKAKARAALEGITLKALVIKLLEGYLEKVGAKSLKSSARSIQCT